MYEPRTYRAWTQWAGLVSFRVVVKETDLAVRACRDLQAEARTATAACRAELEAYIARHPQFLTALEPLDVADDAPPLVCEMASAARLAGVGPMAAVAGGIAESVGRVLASISPDVIVENGGDIWLRLTRPGLVGVYAGRSPLTGRIAFEVWPEDTPLGVCTSSGSVGHSLSFGRADAAVVFAPSAALADAVATAMGNRVRAPADIDGALDWAKRIPGVAGLVVILGERLGLWGDVRIAPANPPEAC